MKDQVDDHLWLTAAECADRLGVTVRTLRLYERRGLIAPRRTGKNWRLYGAGEIARLSEVLALKRLGLSLSRITDLLAGRAIDLDRTLAMQQAALLELRDRAERSLALVNASRAKLSAGEAVSINELIKLVKETKMTDISSDAIAWRRYEQARPRTEIKIDPDRYDDYVGSYQFDFGVLTVTRDKNRLLTQLSGQPAVEIFPESDDEFFLKVVPAQITFIRDAQGAVDSAALHQNGHRHDGTRIDESTAKIVADELANRIKNKTPMPNSEALLRGLIDEHQRGQPDYDRMSVPLAALVREQLPMIQAELARMGALQSISFQGVGEGGWDVYDVRFAHGEMEWRFALGADGKFSGAALRPLP